MAAKAGRAPCSRTTRRSRLDRCSLASSSWDAERALAALERDGLLAAPCGPDGMLTYVDARKVRSPNPGYCYKRVGWVRVGRAKKASKPLLWKPLELAGIPACGARRHERVRPETRAAA
jgi:hypothetical protein